MNDEYDYKREREDKLLRSASELATKISPKRDLWPGIEKAINQPKRSRWTPFLAQAAAVVLLVGASSMVTYTLVKQEPQVIEVTRPDLAADRAAFSSRAFLGEEYRLTHGSVSARLNRELARLSPEDRADIERNLAVIRLAIADINQALSKEPDNELLQELLAKAYREEVAIMQRVGTLAQQVVPRKDI